MHNGPFDCFICRKHRGEVSIPGGAIYQDDRPYVGHAQLPEGKTTCYLGWIIVETKRHVPELADLTDAEAQALGLMVSRVSRALMASDQMGRCLRPAPAARPKVSSLASLRPAVG